MFALNAREQWLFWSMHKDGLPDSKGSLSLLMMFVPSIGIAAANHEIMEATSEGSKKCG